MLPTLCGDSLRCQSLGVDCKTCKFDGSQMNFLQTTPVTEFASLNSPCAVAVNVRTVPGLEFSGDNAEDNWWVGFSSDLPACLLGYIVLEGQPLYLLCFKILVQNCIGDERETVRYLVKSLWERAFEELLKGTMTSYWKSIHSTHYQKMSRCRSKETFLFFPAFQSLPQKDVQRKQTTAKSRNKSSSEKTSLYEV